MVHVGDEVVVEDRPVDVYAAFPVEDHPQFSAFYAAVVLLCFVALDLDEFLVVVNVDDEEAFV